MKIHTDNYHIFIDTKCFTLNKKMKTYKIVVPVDFSNYCKYALEYVELFSSKIDCKVYLISVLDKDGILKNITKNDIIQAEEKLISLAKEWENRVNIKDSAIKIGSIHKEIIEYAEKSVQADIIFMGSHGSVVSSQFFVGSNAEKIVRHFNGDVLVVKHPLVNEKPHCPNAEWHFIGHLQSNKAKALLQGVPNLYMLETVDTTKLADRLNRICGELGRETPLRVLVQVNTSGEESKHGVEPSEATALAAHISGSCPNLEMAGFMTIGMPDYTSKPENFTCLKECRRKAAAELGLDESELELSMGMSGDFEEAIRMGSTEVRVGSSIFGARKYPNKW